MRETLPVLLIVEDDEHIRHLYRVLLENKFRLIEAEDGCAGLKRAQEVVPDLIVTDHKMPRCTGLEMVRRLRSLPNLASVPVAVCSGYLTPELEREFRAAGVAHFLNKPCNSADILKLVAHARTREAPGNDGTRTGTS